MKFKNLHFAYIVIAILGIATLTSNSGGKMGAFSSGCGDSGCHGSSSNNTIVSMKFDGTTTIGAYTPGKKYAIVLSLDNSDFIGATSAKAGFDLKFSLGTLSNTPSGTMLMGTELHHTTPKAITAADGGTTFSFDWTAPAKGAGNVTINIAGNLVNGNGMSTGDVWNTKIISLTEDPGIVIKKPGISSTITAASITTTGASISTQINPNNGPSVAEVQYGLTTSYGSTKAMTPDSFKGSTSLAASATLTGLTPNTTYNYRIKASNSAGDSLSANKTFKTNSAGAAILNTNELAINLYPNPSSDYAIISSNDLTSINEIVAVNMSGRRFSLPIIHTQSDQIRLNTSGLSKGKYFIQIKSGDKTSSLPLLID
jgi:hypothetical protein